MLLPFQYPIANEHATICQQLRFAALHLGQTTYPPLVLNFDAHHDFYPSEVLSASWARQMVRSKEVVVFTILPNLSDENGGGLGSTLLAPPRALCGFDSHHDYRTLTESQRSAYPILSEIKITLDENSYLNASSNQDTLSRQTCALKDYPGPIWISIDYDFFSLHPRYHLSSDTVATQLCYLANFLIAAQILPDEIVGFRSKIYLDADAREKIWLKEVDKALLTFRSYFFLPLRKKERKKIGS